MIHYNALPSRLVESGIHRLLLCNESPQYDTKQSDGQIPIMLKIWGNAEYPFIAIALWHGVVVYDRALSMGQRELS